MKIHTHDDTLHTQNGDLYVRCACERCFQEHVSLLEIERLARNLVAEHKPQCTCRMGATLEYLSAIRKGTK